jgi:nucleotide sugar dehydrogenase
VASIQRDVVVLGMGFVGLTLSAALAKNSVNVVGVDTDISTINSLQSGKPHFYEKNLEEIISSSVNAGSLTFTVNLEKSTSPRAYIIAVGTPLRGNQLDLNAITHVLGTLSGVLIDADLVILRSTVSVGMSRHIKESLELMTSAKFLLAMCPERTLEGVALEELYSLPQIIGAPDPESRIAAGQIFSQITESIIQVNSYEGAEIAKLSNNIVRDVRFALANEIAISCDLFGIDFEEVRRATTEGYPRDGLAKAGPVAGPCLQKDPWIFLESLAKRNREENLVSSRVSLISSAREINEYLPDYFIKKILEVIKQISLSHKTQINLIHVGLAFKGHPVTDDIRGSDAVKIIEYFTSRENLRNFVVDGEISDERLQLLGYESTSRIDGGADIIVVHNNHQRNWGIVNSLIQNCPNEVVLFDIWRVVPDKAALPPTVRYMTFGS